MEFAIDIIFSFLMIAVMVVIATSLIFESKTDIAPVPTLPWVEKKMIDALKRRFKSDREYKVAELGSGWGTLAFAFAKTFPNVKVTGYEISPFPFWFSEFRNKIQSKQKQITFHRDSFFDHDLSDFNVVIFYLSPRHTEKLQEKLERELKPGTIVMSNAFPMPDWRPKTVLKTKVFVEIPIYVYVTPARIEEAGGDQGIADEQEQAQA